MEIKGHLGQMNHRGVWGWAIRKGHQVPINVHLYVNGQWVSSRKADVFRKDLLEQGIHPTGHCGFVFPFEEMGLGKQAEISHYELTVKAGPNRQALPGSLVYDLDNPPRKPTYKHAPLFFIHVPKTGGTAFKIHVGKNFRHEEIYPNGVLLKRLNGRPPNYRQFMEKTQQVGSGISFWVGHVPFVTGDHLGEELNKVIFLREPVDRVISHLKYAYRMILAERRVSIEEVYESFKQNEFDNLQCRYLADSDVHDVIYFNFQQAMDQQGLELAKENLGKCQFLGITEKFQESMSIFTQKFDLTFSAFSKVNSAPNKEKIVIPDYIREEIPALVKWDMKLYEFALKLFQKQQPGI